MRSSHVRGLLALTVLAMLVLASFAGPAAARRGNDRRAERAARFQVTGLVTAVDAAAGTLTVAVKGGSPKGLRGTTQTVTVPADARVRRTVDNADGTETTTEGLTAVQTGDKTQVRGTKAADGKLTAQRVHAHAPEPEDDDSDDAAQAPEQPAQQPVETV